jgi:hypothetical protein
MSCSDCATVPLSSCVWHTHLARTCPHLGDISCLADEGLCGWLAVDKQEATEETNSLALCQDVHQC